MRTASSANCLFWFVAHFLVKIQVTLQDAVLLDVLVWVSETPHPSTNTFSRCRFQIRQNKSFVASLLPIYSKVIRRHGCCYISTASWWEKARRRGSMVTRELPLILLLSSLLDSLHESHDPNSFYLFFLTRFAKHSQRL